MAETPDAESLHVACHLVDDAINELHMAIRAYHAAGFSLRAIAAVTGDSPETVRKIVRAG